MDIHPCCLRLCARLGYNPLEGKFPNVGTPPFILKFVEIAKKEIYTVIPNPIWTVSEEYKGLYSIKASAYGWEFWRTYYYWVAETRRFPLSIPAARKLNESYSTLARINGLAGGDNAEDIIEPISLYHCDTPESLQALIEAIREI